MYKNPQHFIDWLASQNNFTQYSYQNKSLIYFQNPKATYVATYNKWKELGFPVIKKGGIKILCPTFVTLFTTDEGKRKSVKYANEIEKEAIKDGIIETQSIISGYNTKVVFDISCTEATEEDLVRLQIKKENKVNLDEILEKLLEENPIELEHKTVYEDVYEVVKDIIRKEVILLPFDDEAKRIIIEGSTFVVLSSLNVDTSLFKFKTIKNIDYEKDYEDLLNISNTICNGSEHIIKRLMVL